jgi:hypothetical protein
MEKPIVVVGLPRSGSSVLSDILSQSEDYFVFDDLYAHTQALALGADGPLSPEQLDKYVHFLGWQVRARIKFGVFENTKTSLSLDDVDRMDEALRATFRAKPATWDKIMVEWLGRLTLAQGKSRWGFKAPQDFMHIDKYIGLFPGVKFIYLYRDPRKVMVSLKHVNERDGDPRQYHPAVYARYWKLASDSVKEAEKRHPGRILSVKFEELLSDPSESCHRIGSFIESTLGVPQMQNTNSSFGKQSARPTLDATEAWICETIAKEAMEYRGYALGQGKVRLADLPGLLVTTGVFARYQTHRVLMDPAGRQSVLQFLKRI